MYRAPLDDWDSIDVFSHMVSVVLVLWGVAVILGNRYGISGHNFVGLLLGIEMSLGFHYRNLILGISCFRFNELNV